MKTCETCTHLKKDEHFSVNKSLRSRGKYIGWCTLFPSWEAQWKDHYCSQHSANYKKDIFYDPKVNAPIGSKGDAYTDKVDNLATDVWGGAGPDCHTVLG